MNSALSYVERQKEGSSFVEWVDIKHIPLSEELHPGAFGIPPKGAYLYLKDLFSTSPPPARQGLQPAPPSDGFLL